MAATNIDSFNNPQEDGLSIDHKTHKRVFCVPFLKDALHLIVGGLAHHSKVFSLVCTCKLPKRTLLFQHPATALSEQVFQLPKYIF